MQFKTTHLTFSDRAYTALSNTANCEWNELYLNRAIINGMQGKPQLLIDEFKIVTTIEEKTKTLIIDVYLQEGEDDN
jgi:hypothetical protein